MYGVPKPILIVCQPSLLNQWEEDIKKVTNRFRVVQYHGDYRSGSVIATALTKRHAFFDRDSEENAATIILTTPKVLAIRHGPIAVKEWRVKTGRMTELQATHAMQIVDQESTSSLYKCFDTLVIDEATSIKNPLSHSHLACKWLFADFNILVTGTLDLNSVADIRGYMPLIEPILSPWTTANLRRWHLSAETNRFVDCLDGSPQSKVLRPTVTAVEKFLFADNISTIQQGGVLRDLFQPCMCRRSLVSTLNGRTIGDVIPAA